jgi:hypothetical protein
MRFDAVNFRMLFICRRIYHKKRLKGDKSLENFLATALNLCKKIKKAKTVFRQTGAAQ